MNICGRGWARHYSFEGIVARDKKKVQNIRGFRELLGLYRAPVHKNPFVYQ
jgi:hypothetical protein